MKLEIKIAEDLLSQFGKQLNTEISNNKIKLNPAHGKGNIEVSRFPDGIEFYHFKFCLKKTISLASSNPEDSDFFLLNINLSEKPIKKTINKQEFNFQRYLPSGMLFYPRNTFVASTSPPNTAFEIVLIKFHKKMLNAYFVENQNFITTAKGAVIYEDLDFESEELIQKIIKSNNKLMSHSYLLACLSIFFEKMSRRRLNFKYDNLDPRDIKNLFIAASMIRNPILEEIPRVDELAQVAQMGKTKFKNMFKQVFGSAPKQYHQKIKMEYAKEQLLQKLKTPSEISYEFGYAHPSKFTRAFKKYFGMTPTEIG